MWNLLFYREGGQAELSIEEVDALFERMPRFTRIPPRDEDPLAVEPVQFHYQNPISGVEFDFAFQSSPDEEDEPDEEGGADEHEPTPLRLQLPHERPAETAQEAFPIVAEVCQALYLLVLDPQEEGEAPARPDVDALIGSYVRHSQAVDETLAYVRQRGRSFLFVGCALLLLALLALAAGLFWSGNQRHALDAEGEHATRTGPVQHADAHPLYGSLGALKGQPVFRLVRPRLD